MMHKNSLGKALTSGLTPGPTLEGTAIGHEARVDEMSRET
jgi:hypothetical protein